MSVVRLEYQRLFVRAFPWTLAALSIAWLAWSFLQGLQAFLAVESRLAAQPDAPGFTDLAAVPLLAQLAQLTLLLAPLLTMQMLAGERRNGTLATLFATGLSPARIVAGKYLAALGWLLLLLLLTLAMPLVLSIGTHLDWGKLAAASLGVALLMAALAGLGLACSAFASHPALAAGSALIITLLLWTANAGARAAGVHDGPLNYLALTSHLQPLMRGLVDTRDVVYFAIITLLTLTFAGLRLAADKVRG